MDLLEPADADLEAAVANTGAIVEANVLLSEDWLEALEDTTESTAKVSALLSVRGLPVTRRTSDGRKNSPST